MTFTSRDSPLHSEWFSLQGSPLQANGIRLLGVFPPFPGGSLLQVNDIHLKGLPLSTANGICFKGFPLSIANGIRIICVTLSKRMGFAPRGSPSPERMGFASRGSPSLKRLGFAPKGLPLQANGIHIKRVALSKANGIRF